MSASTVRTDPPKPALAGPPKRPACIGDSRRAGAGARTLTATLIGLAFAAVSSAGSAQTGTAPTAQSGPATPVGVWRTINEETNTEQSTVRITEANGVLTGRIEALPNPADQNAVCEKCTDQRKGAKIIGLTIIEGVSNGDGDQYWDGGQILDPKNGKTYSVRLSPLDNGRKLQVRGYLGPFYRTQVWQRVE